MKRVSIILNAIFAVAIIALFVIVLTNQDQVTPESEKEKKSNVPDYGIVYINTDSLIINYQYARLLSEEMVRKEESSRTDINERARVFREDMREFQRKIQNNGFLSLERAQSEEQRLRRKEMELQELGNQMSNELMRHQEQMNMQLRDTITNFLDVYCKDKDYRMVLSNTMGDNVLYAEPVFDITDEVVALLNKRYEASLE